MRKTPEELQDLKDQWKAKVNNLASSLNCSFETAEYLIKKDEEIAELKQCLYDTREWVGNVEAEIL